MPISCPHSWPGFGLCSCPGTATAPHGALAAPRRPRTPILKRLAIAALLCVAGSACGTAPPSSPSAPATASSATTALHATTSSSAAAARSTDPLQNQAALWRQIQASVGDAACDAPQQCHSSAVGSKACGGPSAYLAWSSRRSDAAKLAALLEQHAAAVQRANQVNELMSTCEVISDPGATCSAGRCVLLPRGLGGSQQR